MLQDTNEGVRLLLAAAERATHNDRAGLLLQQAREAADTGDVDGALQAAVEAHRACLSFGDASVVMASLLLHDKGQRESSMAHFQRAVQYDDANPVAQLHLAFDDLARGDHREAELRLATLQQTTPDPLITACQAGVLHLLGRVEEASALQRQLAAEGHPMWPTMSRLLAAADDDSHDELAHDSAEQAAWLARACLRGSADQAAAADPAERPVGPARLPGELIEALPSRFGERVTEQFQSLFLRLFVAPGLLARLRGVKFGCRLGMPAEPRPDADMVAVPAGKYTVGSSAKGSAHRARAVRLAAALLIDRYPVTNKQWRQFDPSHLYGPGQENLPMVNVSALQAEMYARFHGKRLPTESEWEIAARGGNGSPFPWGTSPAVHAANCAEAGHAAPTAVTEHPEGASFCGALDMVGNVQEWTSSWGPADSKEPLRVTKGGDFTQPLPTLRADARGLFAPQQQSAVIGFRCVRDV